jgi:hypothetical protein
MNVVIEIDALVLDGFDPADRFRIQAAMERELTRLVRERGAAALSSLDPAFRALDISSIESPPIHTVAGASSETTGARIAQAVYSVLPAGNPGSKENPR